jgi:hypothetical protein
MIYLRDQAMLESDRCYSVYVLLVLTLFVHFPSFLMEQREPNTNKENIGQTPFLDKNINTSSNTNSSTNNNNLSCTKFAHIRTKNSTNWMKRTRQTY